MDSRKHIPALALGSSIAIVSISILNGMSAAVSFALGCLLLAIALRDARHFIIPDSYSLPAIPAGLIAVYFMTDSPEPNIIVLQHAMAAVAGGAGFYLVRELYRQMRGREGLGLGDVKLIMAAGAWTGMIGLSYVILLACIAAISYVGLVSIIDGRKFAANTAIPFGVFLAPSIWIIWLLSQLAGESHLLF